MRMHRFGRGLLLFVSWLLLAGCLPQYAWKNFDAGRSNDAQLSMDNGECQMIGYQSVPAVAPQQNISQNTYINPYGGNAITQFAIQQQQQNEQQRQRNAQQAAINDSRNNIYSGCMSARGWSKVRVE